jgi:hypothetical protein
VERKVGTGLAVALAVLVVAGVALWAWRRHRSLAVARSENAESAPPTKQAH